MNILETNWISLITPSNHVKSVISLINGGKVILADGFDAESLYPLAKQHQIFGIMLYGTLAAGLGFDAPVVKKLYSGALAETVFHEKQKGILTALFNAFNDSDIAYMPLKGSLIKELYPRPELRVMSDADILVKQEQLEKVSSIMLSLGYTSEYESDHEIVWKKNGLTIELHKHLIPSYNEDYYHYFTDVWQIAELKENSRYGLSENDEFIYVFTHLAKHYRDGGIGMKHFIDIWFMLEKYDLDTDYIRSELRKLHLDIFFDNVLNTLSFWFDNGQPDAKTEMIIQTVIDSGAYGSSEDQLTGRAARNTERNHSKFRAMLSMLFPSFKVLKVSYKYLEKAPFLLPIAWISRWCDALFLHRNRLSRGAKYIKVTTSDTVEKHVHALQLVGIEYNLKKDEKP